MGPPRSVPDEEPGAVGGRPGPGDHFFLTTFTVTVVVEPFATALPAQRTFSFALPFLSLASLTLATPLAFTLAVPTVFLPRLTTTLPPRGVKPVALTRTFIVARLPVFTFLATEALSDVFALVIVTETVVCAGSWAALPLKNTSRVCVPGRRAVPGNRNVPSPSRRKPTPTGRPSSLTT